MFTSYTSMMPYFLFFIHGKYTNQISHSNSLFASILPFLYILYPPSTLVTVWFETLDLYMRPQTPSMLYRNPIYPPSTEHLESNINNNLKK